MSQSINCLDDEIADKIKSWPKCDENCNHHRVMVDVVDSGYEIAFCDEYMEAICKGTHCNYYKPRKDHIAEVSKMVGGNE